MAINGSQIGTLKLWLALVAGLALFPPFEVDKIAGGNLQMIIGGETSHEFVLSGGITPVNLPSFGDSTDPSAIPHVKRREVNFPALLCELIALSAVAGWAFVSLGDAHH